MILYNYPGVAVWAAKRLGVDPWPPGCATIAALRHGKLVAAAVYSNYSHPDIWGHFVTVDRHWSTPPYVRACFRYPFVQLGCKRVTALTEATNQPMRAFLCRLGFREEGVHPDAFNTGDGISYGLLRKDAARWLAEEDGGEIFGAIAA